MKRIFVLTLLVFFTISAFVASTSSAGKPGNRQIKQRARIQHGVSNGTLVPREARRLAAQQHRIQAVEKRMRADGGKLDAGERARLDRKQDRASRRIFRAKHNGRAR